MAMNYHEILEYVKTRIAIDPHWLSSKKCYDLLQEADKLMVGQTNRNDIDGLIAEYENFVDSGVSVDVLERFSIYELERIGNALRTRKTDCEYRLNKVTKFHDSVEKHIKDVEYRLALAEYCIETAQHVEFQFSLSKDNEE